MKLKNTKTWNKYLKYKDMKPSEKELYIFLKNATEEEKNKCEIECLSHGNINSAMLTTCEAYGLMGKCGKECPLFNNCEYQDQKGFR